MGCVACVAICMAATTSQDLKTGFLLGATPRSQQIAEIIGVIVPSLALGYTIYILNSVYQIGSDQMPAPQAMFMSIIANGVINGELPYYTGRHRHHHRDLLALLRVPILPFALGLYPPLSLDNCADASEASSVKSSIATTHRKTRRNGEFCSLPVLSAETPSRAL